ncbi:MAG: pentapeptide repeat-containing protein [Burkholderiales bacterium]|nr:pentapeptide repeat-containing protein [Burkholderiales bacterium]
MNNSLISKHRYQVLGLFSVILFEPYVDLSGLNLNYAALMWANLTGVNLTGVNLTGANLHQANLTDANLTNANLHQANLTDANLTNANLTNAHLHQANLTGAHLTNAHLIDANLTGANLTGANLTGANLTGANLRWADLTGANLTGANLSRANLSGANLSRANLSGANLTEANLNQANLSGADLSGANLTEANLNQANLTEANLNQANLSGADLRGANLSGAILSGVYLRWANLRGANLREADFRGAILSPVQTQYIRSSGGILDQAQPPTTDPDDPQILAQTTPQSASPTEKNETNETNGGVVIGGNTILTPEENLQLLRDLGIDPTGIRPDLLDDPTLKNLLREFRHTGDKEKARAKIAEWLKLKGVDLTPLALPPHTGDEDKPNLEMLNTKFPEPKPNDRKITASQRPPPQADPPLTQALSNLKNSVDPARLMRAWSKADDPQLIALLTFEGLQQVLAYGLEGKLLIGLSQYNLSRFLIAYNTENVLSRIINDPEVSSTVKASAQKMLSSVQNVLNEARLAPFKSALKELERRSPEDRTALILGWAKDRDPRLLLLLGTEQGLRLVLDAGMGGSFLTALAQGYSGWLRHLNTANLLQKLAQENPGTPLGTAAQNLLSRVNNVLRAATTPPQKAAERTDNLPSKVEQPNLINPITPSALDSSVQALRQAKTPEQRLEALNVVRTTLQELLNLMTMNPNEQLQGLSLMQQQFVGLIIEKLQEALKWVNDPQREKDAAYIAQGTWEFAVSGLSALAASIGFLWSLRPDGTS